MEAGAASPTRGRPRRTRVAAAAGRALGDGLEARDARRSAAFGGGGRPSPGSRPPREARAPLEFRGNGKASTKDERLFSLRGVWKRRGRADSALRSRLATMIPEDADRERAASSRGNAAERGRAARPFPSRGIPVRTGRRDASFAVGDVPSQDGEMWPQGVAPRARACCAKFTPPRRRLWQQEPSGEPVDGRKEDPAA